MLHLTSRLARLGATAALLSIAIPVTLSTSANAQVLETSQTTAATLTAQTAQGHTYRDVTVGGITGNVAIPLATKVFTVGVKCGWWSGTVQWGGLGLPSSPAYIQVTGTVHSSCNSTTYVHIKYTEDMRVFGYTLFAKTGPESSGPADYYTTSLGGQYGNIIIQVCSNRYGWTCASHKA